MTILERVKQIIKNGVDMSDKSTASLEKMVYMAYYIGCEEAAKRVCNKAADLIEAQHQRAKSCRYYKMAEGVVGDDRMLYDCDYSGDMTDMFGNDPADV